jgi:hypothetical protein
MSIRNLDEAARFYKCFSNIEKLRIWNLFLIPLNEILIPSDVQKTLNLSSGVFNHFREFHASGLIEVDIWGKRKVYFFANQKFKEFVHNTIQSINDEQLQKDRQEFHRLKISNHLQISGQAYAIKNKRVIFFKTIKKEMVRTHERNYIWDLINSLSRAIKHNRINQINDLKTKLDEVSWNEFPELEEKANQILKRIK